MIRETLAMAFEEIRRNPMRSVLTTLGVVIGVAAVVAMVTLGQSATAQVTSEVASLGHNLLVVRPGVDRPGPPTSGGAEPFDARDVAAVERAARGVAIVAPSSSRSMTVIARDANHPTEVVGATPAWFEARSYALAAGRGFGAGGGLRSVCLVGPTVVEDLFGSRSPLGESLRVGRVSCTISGVLAAKGSSGFGPDPDDVVIMPLDAFRAKIAGDDDVDTIYVGVRGAGDVGRVAERIRAALRSTRRIEAGADDDFTVRDMREVAQTFSNVTRILTAFLGAVGAVSLLVGGIGIMNVMLVSVTERTREIGVRLAIGARPRDVLRQFLFEAMALSSFGGALGVATGLLLSAVATWGLSLPWAPNAWVIVGAFAFCALLGVAFGYLPARRAARLDPIEALRHE